MSDYGSVEGTLHKDRHGFFLKDIMLPRRVWVWSNIVLDDYVGKRISIEGDLEYDKNGDIISIDHYHLNSRPCLPFVFKPDSELPTANDVRGILSNKRTTIKNTRDLFARINFVHLKLINFERDYGHYDTLNGPIGILSDCREYLVRLLSMEGRK